MTHSQLDAKAREVAILAGSAECREYGIPEPHDGIYEAAIRAYLSAIHSQEAAAPSGAGDAPENIIDNPKSWAAWKREADSWRRVAERLESEKQAASPAPVAVAPVERMLLGWMLAAFEQSKVGWAITDDLKREMRDANRLVARLSASTAGGAGT